MRIKTGETVTESLTIDLLYQCSSCGAVNQSVETIKGSASTASVMGVNIAKNLSARASENLRNNLTAVLDENNPERFRSAGFTCKCRSCGHAEPWAKLNFERLDKFYTTTLALLIAFVFVSVVGLCYGALNIAMYFMWGVMALCAAVCVGINVYKSKRIKKMEAEIAVLPKKSIPTIVPHGRNKTN